MLAPGVSCNYPNLYVGMVPILVTSYKFFANSLSKMVVGSCVASTGRPLFSRIFEYFTPNIFLRTVFLFLCILVIFLCLFLYIEFKLKKIQKEAIKQVTEVIYNCLKRDRALWVGEYEKVLTKILDDQTKLLLCEISNLSEATKGLACEAEIAASKMEMLAITACQLENNLEKHVENTEKDE